MSEVDPVIRRRFELPCSNWYLGSEVTVEEIQIALPIYAGMAEHVSLLGNQARFKSSPPIQTECRPLYQESTRCREDSQTFSIQKFPDLKAVSRNICAASRRRKLGIRTFIWRNTQALIRHGEVVQGSDTCRSRHLRAMFQACWTDISWWWWRLRDNPRSR